MTLASPRRLTAEGDEYTLEVCVDSLESAKESVTIDLPVQLSLVDRAAKGSANRLELCANLGVGGGTTPSMGLVRAIKRELPDMPIMVMIRPRVGDFLYSPDEIDVMCEDIRAFKEIGVDGVVLGVLDADGDVDTVKLRALVDEARPLEALPVTFHRAFDLSRDPLQALDQIRTVPGVTRVLTSGQGKTAPESLPMLRTIAQNVSARGGPIIVPGSGINKDTVGGLLFLRELHLSGGGWVEGGMSFRRGHMGMGADGANEWNVWKTDWEKVRGVRDVSHQRIHS